MFQKIQFAFLFYLLAFNIAYSQDNSNIAQKFEELSVQKKGLKEVMKIDVSGLTLFDFITSIAQEHKLNVSVESDLNQLVINNFNDVTVKDVFLFLIQKYNLDVEFMSNIIIFKKKPVITIIEKKPQKVIDITYNVQNDFLSVRLQNDSLTNVVSAIIDKSGKNLVLAPDVKNLTVSSYILNRPFDQVIDMMAKSNDLVATKDENGFYYIEKAQNIPGAASNEKIPQKIAGQKVAAGLPGFFEVIKKDDGLLTVRANSADSANLLIEAAEKLNANYFLYNKPDNEKTTLFADGITYDQLLEHIFKGKKYTYRKDANLYLIGEQTTEGLRATEIIQLEFRSIETVLGSLPKVFTEKLEIKEFVELNGLIVSGPKSIIDELRVYVKQIDKVVLMVQIEVIIVQYNKSYEIQTGIQAGLGTATTAKKTSGVLFPTTDVNLDASSVNNLVDAFNGLGFFKLGKVTESFYLNLKLLENNSIIKIESTPKIATISGHEAKLAIGETSYYFEQNNRLINSGVGNDILQSGTWKETNANLSVSIKPFVSTDENVTLTVVVEKNSFLGRAGETAPPGKATQRFESLVRVKNNEMVLLGGLDELQKENSGTGTPLISRIPVLKWFFSSRRKANSNSKLHLFIKPTIVY